jgi:hypothetical protein
VKAQKSRDRRSLLCAESQPWKTKQTILVMTYKKRKSVHAEGYLVGCRNASRSDVQDGRPFGDENVSFTCSMLHHMNTAEVVSGKNILSSNSPIRGHDNTESRERCDKNDSRVRLCTESSVQRYFYQEILSINKK